MSVFLEEKLNEIAKVYESDTTIFPDNIRKKIRKRIEDFVEKPKDKNFKFSKFKDRKNDKPVKFSITSSNPATDATFKEEAKKIHSDNNPPTTKLNY